MKRYENSLLTSPRGLVGSGAFVQLVRRALIVTAFNVVLTVAHLASKSTPWEFWDVDLFYTSAVGYSIWGLTECSRWVLARIGQAPHGWPSAPRTAAMVAACAVAGWLVGTTLGDTYCGCSQMELVASRPKALVSTALFTIGAATVISYFLYSRSLDTARRERIALVERDAANARLTLLQSQLEPHMLFNTLANLRVLIALEPTKAQGMLDRIIAFLRATLVASRTEAHSLAVEFARLDDYLQLMAVRMGPRLQTSFELPTALRSIAVPTLLLQPLVENSIRHGLDPKVEGGRLVISARREGDRLVLEVRDTGLGLGVSAAKGTRFGLQQVRERLATLYGDVATLSLAAAPDAGGGALARIVLPWTATDAARTTSTSPGPDQ